jgi:hypothetical protein
MNMLKIDNDNIVSALDTLLQCLVAQAGINICNCRPEDLADPDYYCPCIYNWYVEEFELDVHSCRLVIKGREFWIKAVATDKADHDVFKESIKKR